MFALFKEDLFYCTKILKEIRIICQISGLCTVIIHECVMKRGKYEEVYPNRIIGCYRNHWNPSNSIIAILG